MEKLKKHAEAIDFNDEQDFADKVKTVKETYFKSESNDKMVVEVDETDEDGFVEATTDVMNSYITAIPKSSK